MDALAQKAIDCPYCGELIEVLIDPQDAEQQYIEDCQVCCKPITFCIAMSMSGELSVAVYHENEAF